MSMQSLMKNIYNYFDVLQAAHGEKAGCWDNESLHRAYKWAAYCVQINRQAEGKPYRGELDRNICKLNENPWSLGDLVINLELLKSAKDILTRALLQNNHLSANVYEELIQMNMGDGIDNLVEICSELATQKSALELAGTIRTEMDDALSQSILQSSSQQTNGLLLLKHVQHTLDNCNKDKRQRTIVALEGKLKDLCQDSSGMNAVLMAICNEPSDEQYYQEAQQFIADYLLGALNSDNELRRRLYEADGEFLSALCKAEPRFCTVFAQQLKERATHFVPDYSTIPVKWRYNTPPGEFNKDFTYEEFLNTVKTVLNTDSHTRTTIMEGLVAESKKTDFNIWKTVLKDI